MRRCRHCSSQLPCHNQKIAPSTTQGSPAGESGMRELSGGGRSMPAYWVTANFALDHGLASQGHQILTNGPFRFQVSGDRFQSPTPIGRRSRCFRKRLRGDHLSRLHQDTSCQSKDWQAVGSGRRLRATNVRARDPLARYYFKAGVAKYEPSVRQDDLFLG